MNWNDQQLAAIDDRGSNLLVAASAGTGKTAVLVERIIRLITKDKVDIDRLLVVTFTQAAAGEMRERICNALLKEMEKEENSLDHLIRQMQLLPRASISTIHAFCTGVVRKHFHQVDIDPHFRIGDPGEIALLKVEVLDEVLEGFYETGQEIFLELVEMFGGSKSDKPFADLVLRIYEFTQSHPYPLSWLEEHTSAFRDSGLKLDQTNWGRELISQIRVQLTAAADLFKEARTLCASSQGPQEYLIALAEDEKIVEMLLRTLAQGWHEFNGHLAAVAHPRLPRVSPERDKNLVEKVKKLREEGKQLIRKLTASIFDQSPDQSLQDIYKMSPYLEYLHQVVKAFADAYQEAKLGKGILDFSDLEHYALQILADPEVAGEYQKKYSYIFVDEYQDSNLVQESIINCIKGPDNLFMVGDIKQSIYRFRLADPTIFLHKYNSFVDQKGAINRRLQLKINFRSRTEILDCVNFLFKNLMSKDLGEFDYHEDSFLLPAFRGDRNSAALPDDKPRVQLMIIDSGNNQEEEAEETTVLEEELEELTAAELEARTAASKIRELVGQPFYDVRLGRVRNLEYRDFAVLLRVSRNWIEVFLETFLEQGIPSYADTGTGYFETMEIDIMMNLLRITDNVRQDIPLMGVMRSPVAQFTIEELTDIRLGSPSKSFFEAIEDYRRTKNDQLKKKLDDFLGLIYSWKEQVRYMALDEFLWKVMIDTGFYYFVGAMPGGTQRQANLRLLLDRARLFHNSTVKGLFNFIKYVEKLKASRNDMGTARILGENDNVVRIMTIHKSKGLEFPVVIIAGAGKAFNLSDMNDRLLLHKDLGIGPVYVDTRLRGYRDTIARLAIKNRHKMERLSEEIRILYVAMTRAMDRMIILGTLNDINKRIKKWQKSLNAFNLSMANSFLDWIGTILLRHQDGKVIRQMGDRPEMVREIQVDPSRWSIILTNRTQIGQQTEQQLIDHRELQKYLEEFTIDPQSDDYREINNQLGWEYPHLKAIHIPSKLAVTRISRPRDIDPGVLGINIPYLARLPEEDQAGSAETVSSGLTRGSAYHLVMQHIDLARVQTEEEIHEQLMEMIRRELISQHEADLIDIKKILGFFRSCLGKRVLGADKVFREISFNQVRLASEILPGLDDCQEKILIQGVIDLYFIEGENVVLVDYKTGNLNSELGRAPVVPEGGNLNSELGRTSVVPEGGNLNSELGRASVVPEGGNLNSELGRASVVPEGGNLNSELGRTSVVPGGGNLNSELGRTSVVPGGNNTNVDGQDIFIKPEYRSQLSIYRSALETIQKCKVHETYLYFFDLDREVRIDS
jgi:ATP-dependent helicase/nuclease subunit A